MSNRKLVLIFWSVLFSSGLLAQNSFKLQNNSIIYFEDIELLNTDTVVLKLNDSISIGFPRGFIRTSSSEQNTHNNSKQLHLESYKSNFFVLSNLNFLINDAESGIGISVSPLYRIFNILDVGLTAGADSYNLLNEDASWGYYYTNITTRISKHMPGGRPFFMASGGYSWFWMDENNNYPNIIETRGGLRYTFGAGMELIYPNMIFNFMISVNSVSREIEFVNLDRISEELDDRYFALSIGFGF